jgi:predicted ATPase
MQISHVKLKNWRNFLSAEANLGTVNYVIGPNASGKSNFLDVFRFLRDVARPEGGGLQKAIADRGGLPKLRCLHARRDTEVFLEIQWVSEPGDSRPAWVYRLGIKSEGAGANRPRVAREEVLQLVDGKMVSVLKRPDAHDKADPELMTQTALEQIQANRGFRDLSENFAGTTYLHLVPQLLRFGDSIGGNRLESDPFGQAFLERVAKTGEKARQSRLTRIKKALANAIPQFEDIRFIRDENTGRPHLEAKYSHHRPHAGWQREDQLSDGTLRLIALFWLLMEGESLLLLEEPELSLDEEIVRNLPRLIDRVSRSTKKRQRQIVITTHSQALLDNPAIDGRWILRIERFHEGTNISAPTADELELMRSGISAAEVLLPQAHPKGVGSMALN